MGERYGPFLQGDIDIGDDGCGILVLFKGGKPGDDVSNVRHTRRAVKVVYTKGGASVVVVSVGIHAACHGRVQDILAIAVNRLWVSQQEALLRFPSSHRSTAIEGAWRASLLVLR